MRCPVGRFPPPPRKIHQLTPAAGANEAVRIAGEMREQEPP